MNECRSSLTMQGSGAPGEVAAVGIDIGSVAIKGIALDCEGAVLRKMAVSGSFSLGDSLADLLFSLSGGRESISLGVTGAGKHLCDSIAGVCLENDLLATVHATSVLFPHIRTILEVGGHGSRWIKLGREGMLESFAFNEQCAAGSGSFLEQQAGRLRIGIEEFSRLAADAPHGASIAGRCSVFAKSDMIHLQQKGIPPDEIAYGLCLALARNFRSTLLKGNNLVKPALFCGGGALNLGLYRAFLEMFEVGPEVLALAGDPQFPPSYGMALRALISGQKVRLAAIAAHVRSRFMPEKKEGSRFMRLRPSGRRTGPEPVIVASRAFDAYMGVDVGSVSTDFCLLSPSGEVLDGLYLPTRGDPIAVIREGLSIIQGRAGEFLNVLGVGTTGSGRHLAGRLLGADVVKNEITCQLMGARHICPDVDTILEIGGQDSKYVSVRNGRISDFVMNKICAAGTGSFLEEQAETLGVPIREKFSELAMESEAPLDLGRQCTVFMDTAVSVSKQRGTEVNDILSGLAYSIAGNYLDMVVAGRAIGEHIVFQGGVASNEAVVSAFEALLGKRITVHPFNRISGALGAALAASREMGGQGTERPKSSFIGFGAVQSVEAVTFTCRNCSNCCQVTKVKASGKVSCFGDVCERYASQDGHGARSSLPDLFRMREEILESFAGGEPRRGTAGIPRSSFLYDTFPFWAAFLRSLGFRVVLSRPTVPEIVDSAAKRLAAETCLPIKLTYGHVASLLDERIDFIFMPSIADLPDEKGRAAPVCPFVESVPFMVSTFARGRMIVPTLSLSAGKRNILDDLRAAFSSFSISAAEISEAYDEALSAQHGFLERLREIGRKVLEGDFPFAFVILGKPYNCHDPFLNLNLTQHIRKLGVLPIPADMLPVSDLSLEGHGINATWHYNRQNLSGLLSLSRDQRLFPLIVSNFGCGPDAFSLKYLDYLPVHRPHLVLEFDEHRGEAGLITRLEAFIDEVTWQTHTEGNISLRTIAHHEGGERERFRGRRFVIPFFADQAHAYAGALKYDGFDAMVLPMPDEETLQAGEEFCSGKECHPYIILTGDLIKHVRRGTIGAGDVFFFPGTTASCLLSQYPTGMRMALEKMGIQEIELFTPDIQDHLNLFSFQGLTRLWRGLVASDLLIRAMCQFRPYVADPESVDSVIGDAFSSMIDMIGSDHLDMMLKGVARSFESMVRLETSLPLVGVAGDIYTRIHPFGNRNLFRHLESMGLEVWPAPLMTDSVDFGLRKAILGSIHRGRYRDSASAALLLLNKEMESWKVRFLFGTPLEHWTEPGYQETVELAKPYLSGAVNPVLLQNVAKMLDYVRRGADGVINAISFHCMMGTIAASLIENIRERNDMVPITTLVYSGRSGQEIEAKLEAFVHQVKIFRARREGSDPSLYEVIRRRLSFRPRVL